MNSIDATFHTAHYQLALIVGVATFAFLFVLLLLALYLVLSSLRGPKLPEE